MFDFPPAADRHSDKGSTVPHTMDAFSMPLILPVDKLRHRLTAGCACRPPYRMVAPHGRESLGSVRAPHRMVVPDGTCAPDIRRAANPYARAPHRMSTPSGSCTPDGMSAPDGVSVIHHIDVP